eukprot:368844-Karenia_brevis.AAC.1
MYQGLDHVDTGHGQRSGPSRPLQHISWTGHGVTEPRKVRVRQFCRTRVASSDLKALFLHDIEAAWSHSAE